MWCYPKAMNLIQMITIIQMGSPGDGVTALMYLKVPPVVHFDKQGQGLAQMHRVMKVIIHFTKLNDVLEP